MNITHLIAAYTLGNITMAFVGALALDERATAGGLAGAAFVVVLVAMAATK